MTTISQKYIIIKDRVEIYKDFTLNLLYYINKYYIDKKTLSDDVDIRNHFNWCFNKVCNEFLKEEIDFTQNDELREYFFTYYYHQFYKANDYVQDTSLKDFEKFWRTIFDIEKQKNKNFVNILIEIYKIYDKSISKEKNILEIV